MNSPNVSVAQDVHLTDYWFVIVKRRRLIAICIAVALVIGAVVSIISRPTYKATVVLDIEKEKANQFDVTNPAQAYWSYDPEFLPTQTRLMRSREVAERVVQKLNLTANSEINPPSRGFFGGAGASKASKDLITRAASALQSGIEVI